MYVPDAQVVASGFNQAWLRLAATAFLLERRDFTREASVRVVRADIKPIDISAAFAEQCLEPGVNAIQFCERHFTTRDHRLVSNDHCQHASTIDATHGFRGTFQKHQLVGFSKVIDLPI
jgi:hypothetical protein